MTAKIIASNDGLSGSLAVGANEAFQFKPVGGGLELSQDGIIFQTVDTNGKVAFPQTSLASSGPAFSAVKAGVQSITGTPAKVIYGTEEFDTNSCYDTTTSRFTPNVPGYYQINAAWGAGGSNSGNSIAVRKNGVEYKVGTYTSTVQAAAVVTVSALVYMNGSTDYVEIYGSNVTTQNSTADTGTNYFQGFLARAA